MKFLVEKAPQSFIKSINDEITSLLNRHFDDSFSNPDYWYNNSQKCVIPVEVSDKGENYELKAELPGIKKENLDIDIDENYVVINAKKEDESQKEENNYKRSEFQYGEFLRTIYFPEEIDIEKTQAELKDGILKLHAPKKTIKTQNRKKLEIK